MRKCKASQGPQEILLSLSQQSWIASSFLARGGTLGAPPHQLWDFCLTQVLQSHLLIHVFTCVECQWLHRNSDFKAYL